MISFLEIRSFCRAREVDIVMVPPTPPFTVSLSGQFDGYSEFFTVSASDVEFVEIAGGITVGDIVMAPELRALASIVPKWISVHDLYSGPAMAIRSADSTDWATARHDELFVLVANRIQFTAGRDWSGV